MLREKKTPSSEGKPKLIMVKTINGVEEKVALQLSASLEQASEHPLAEAIVRGAQEKGIEMAEVKDFHSVTGKGVTSDVEGRKVALGNLKLLES